MNTLEAFQAGLISYNDAVTQLVTERSKNLHEATSGRGVDPQATASRRLSAYKRADDCWQQLKQVWYIQSTPPAFQETIISHRLQSSYKGTALYVTPSQFQPDQISHTPLTADEKFARENLELLNLDVKMARIAALGLRGEK